MTHTPGSGGPRQGLAQGRCDIAHGGVDNAVAMEAGGAAIGVPIGGDSAFNSLFAKPRITRRADLPGRAPIVHAPDTACALVAHRMPGMAWLPRGTFEIRPTVGGARRFEPMMNDPSAPASMLNPSFSVMGAERGLVNLGDAGGAMRARSAANAEAAAGLLAERLRLTPDIARRSHAVPVAPGSGPAVDGRFDMEGFRAVLRPRAQVLGTWGGTPPEPGRFLDLAHRERAVASLA